MRDLSFPVYFVVLPASYSYVIQIYELLNLYMYVGEGVREEKILIITIFLKKIISHLGYVCTSVTESSGCYFRYVRRVVSIVNFEMW